MTNFHDGYTNLLTGLGDPTRDKLAGVTIASPIEYTDKHWQDLHRDNWLAKAIVDKPAHDATREWREWMADAADISKLEAEETRLRMPDVLKQAYINARLYGKGFVYFETGGEPSEPVDPRKVRRIDFATPLSRREVIDGDVQDDPMLPGYGEPKWYEVATTSRGSVRIHPSRMIVLYGDVRPGDYVFGRKADSVLRRCYDPVMQYGVVHHNVAALTFEAKVDIWMIPELARVLADKDQEESFLKVQQVANMLKGVHGTVFQDAGTSEMPTKYERKTQSFATLPDIMAKYEDQICGAVGYSKAYLFGESGAGMGNNGQSTLEMDYGKIAQLQKTVLQPAMSVFDECLIWSSLRNRPDDLFYNWRSLWSMSDAERAKIGLDIANTFKAAVDADIAPLEVLTPAFVNAMTESGGVAMETYYNEWIEGGGMVDDATEEDGGDVG